MGVNAGDACPFHAYMASVLRNLPPWPGPT